MASIEIIDDAICIEESDESLTVRLGPLLLGDGPVFEMHDETLFDRVKKVFLNKDLLIDNHKVDERFFISGHPGPLHPLESSIASKLGELPLGTSFECDGKILTLRLPHVSEESRSTAIEMMKTLAKKSEAKLAAFARTPGAQRQARVSWSQCPSPQLIIRTHGVPIDVFVPWRGPISLCTHNINYLSRGVLSLRSGWFYPDKEDDNKLFDEFKQAAGQEFAPSLGNTASLSSSVDNNNLQLNLHTEPNEQNARAAIELLVRLAAPKGGPFR